MPEHRNPLSGGNPVLSPTTRQLRFAVNKPDQLRLAEICNGFTFVSERWIEFQFDACRFNRGLGQIRSYPQNRAGNTMLPADFTQVLLPDSLSAGYRLAATGNGTKAGLLGFGAIEVDGERYDHDIVIEAGKVRKRKKRDSTAV